MQFSSRDDIVTFMNVWETLNAIYAPEEGWSGGGGRGLDFWYR